MLRPCSSLLLAPLCGVLGTVASAHAQSPPPTPDDPKVFVWSNGIPCDYTPQQDHHLVAMARLYLGPNTSGVEAANLIAAYVKDHTTPNSTWRDINNLLLPYCGSTVTHAPDMDTTPNTICVTMQNFGYDVSETSGSCETTWFCSPLRFYSEVDRLPDYIGGTTSGIYSTNDGDFGFPTNPPVTNPGPAWYTNRTYRHPFLWNGRWPRSPRACARALDRGFARSRWIEATATRHRDRPKRQSRARQSNDQGHPPCRKGLGGQKNDPGDQLSRSGGQKNRSGRQLDRSGRQKNDPGRQKNCPGRQKNCPGRQKNCPGRQKNRPGRQKNDPGTLTLGPRSVSRGSLLGPCTPTPIRNPRPPHEFCEAPHK
jgi:hypothetical protein